MKRVQSDEKLMRYSFRNLCQRREQSCVSASSYAPLRLGRFWCISLRGYSVSHLIFEQQQTRIGEHVTEVFQVPGELHRLEHLLRMYFR